MSKLVIRKKMQALRDALDPNDKANFDKRICQRLSELVQQRKIKTIHTYLPMGSEVDVYPFIEQMLYKKLTVVAPKCLSEGKLEHLVLQSLDNLEKGMFDTKHPANTNEYFGAYDLILVPGLAFDLRFNRIGYGGGYYDVFLENQRDAYKLGLSYPFQIVDQLPREPHDVRLDGVLS